MRGELGRVSLGDALDLKRNSLNALRLALALCVLVSHAASIGFFGNGWALIYNQTSLAQVALYGFFGISGYLLAASAMRSNWLSYLWHRFLRIFPGLVVCVVVTAFGFGVLVWYHTHPACGFSCYFHAKDSPLGYVLKDGVLLDNPDVRQVTVAGTPHFPGSWNASIWTLFYEFVCYLALLGLALTGFLRHRVVTLCATLMLWLAVLLATVTPSISSQFTVTHNVALESLIRLSLVFFTGTTLYLYRDRVPDSGWIALGCTAMYAFAIALPTSGRIPTFQFTPADIFVPLAAYPILWLGAHLPLQRVGTVNDYSYGIYVYGWPISCVLLSFGVERWGPIPYMLTCVACTAPFAVASWWLIEKRALSLKRLSARAVWSRIVGEPAQ